MDAGASSAGLYGHSDLVAQSSAGWQLVLLPVRPQILDRVEIGRIARKKLHPEAPALLADEIPRSGDCDGVSVPDDEQLAGSRAQ